MDVAKNQMNIQSHQGLNKLDHKPLRADVNQVPGEFNKLLDLKQVNSSQELAPQAASGVQFSSHAVERMQQRGIRFSPEDVSRIDSGIEQAGKKGAKETLLLMDDRALIVGVDAKKVITVMDRESLKNNVFTNIDSTLIL